MRALIRHDWMQHAEAAQRSADETLCALNASRPEPVAKKCSHIEIPSRCRTIIRITSHPRQIPCEGWTVRARRRDLNVRRTRGGKRQQPFGSATPVCVLRRVGSPHGGAYVGMFAAAQGAIRVVSITDLRAGSPGTPASPRQANLGCLGMRNSINRDRCGRS